MNHMHSDKLTEWLAGIEHLHPRNIEMGLERVRVVKQRLGIRFECPVIIVGGTNGKGSTCTMMQHIWQEAGYQVGLFTSPHIHQFQERLQLSGQNLPDAVFVQAFKKVEAARQDTPLTFFEFTTLAILQILSEAELDVIILEVGLGGRLDAVNLIDATVAVITNVDIDHVDYLGDTRELIAYEKAGIFRTGKVAVYGDYDPPLPLLEHAAAIDADLRILGRDYSCECHGRLWDYIGRDCRIVNLEKPALLGKNQIKNATNVLMVLEAMQAELPVDDAAVRRGLAQAYLPGRFQLLQTTPAVIVDAAHNPHAAATLAENLRNMGDFDATYAVFGAMSDKDIDGVIAPMLHVVNAWFLTGLPLSRAATTDHLRQKLLQAGVLPEQIFIHETAANALDAAKSKAAKDDRIIAFGSFWIVTGVTQTESADSSTL